MPPTQSGSAPSAEDLLRDLGALRDRLDQAQAWFNRPRDSLRAGALAEEVKRLCQEATRSEDPEEIHEALAGAQARLQELQVLLGTH